MKKILFLILVTVPIIVVVAQTCNSNSLIIQQIRAKDTDANIDFELKKHYSFYNPNCTTKNTLIVHLVGSFDSPSSTLLFPEQAANNGFHVVSLKYPNGTAAKNACGNSSDPNCYLNFRKEIIEGFDYSPDIAVDSSNSINNRLIKLLQYLENNNPGQNWSNYFSGNTINWSAIIISGHSQGGGHAAVIAITNPVKRVLMFASPNDYSTFFNAPAPWTSIPHTALDSIYYGFNNVNDDVVNFSEQFEMWNNLGMSPFGDTVNVETTVAPYLNSRQLFTTYDTTGLGGNHSVMILDSKTPRDNSGQPLFKPVWEYMLGVSSLATTIEESFLNVKLSIYPNPFKKEGTLLFDNPNNKNHTFTIFDITGKRLTQIKNITNNQVQIKRKQLKAGIYFFELKNEKSIVGKGRFVIE